MTWRYAILWNKIDFDLEVLAGKQLKEAELHIELYALNYIWPNHNAYICQVWDERVFESLVQFYLVILQNILWIEQEWSESFD